MTQREVRAAINNSPNREWFEKSIRVVINLPHIEIQEELAGLATIHQFIEQEVRNWEQNKGDLPSVLNNSYQHFKQVSSNLDSFVTTYVTADRDLNQVTSAWSKIKGRIESQTLGNDPIFIADAPETGFLINLQKNLPKSIVGASDYIAQQRLSQHQLQNQDYITGVLQAYEWKLADHSTIQKARKSQKASISRIRTQFYKYLNEAEKDLEQHYRTNSDKAKIAAEAFQTLVAEKKEHFEGWFKETSKEFGDFHTVSKKNLEDLEELYEKKLQLHAPAKFWKTRAEGLNVDGKRWLWWLISSSVIASLLLFALLVLITTDRAKDVFSDTGLAIKWSIVFITFISFLAFSIRTFAKLTFSAFHLKRDAEERRMLVYVYLALKKDEGIDETERHLVMQSIFSRADSGLLKEDASPTMPGNIVDKVFKGS